MTFWSDTKYALGYISASISMVQISDDLFDWQDVMFFSHIGYGLFEWQNMTFLSDTKCRLVYW